eukprot:m.31736 g.31736  ORF g.31736 m.31736 type:complete len:452 (+) comp8343_c0_seq2:82-1437(+)
MVSAMRSTLSLSLLCVLPITMGLNNGLGRTPPMGYNAYDHVGCCASEATMLKQAQAMKDNGLIELGYTYVNSDCGWIGGRHPNGTLYESPTKFPSGMKSLADKLHSMGLKLGLYSDRGPNDFSGKGLGIKGHEMEDAKVMADWGVDYLKVDDMSGSPHTSAGAYADYARIRDALNATGRPIFFSTCGHSPGHNANGTSGGPSWMGQACPELANACRIASDVRFWGPGEFGTHKAINVMSFAGLYSEPGAWADPDLLFSYTDPRTPNATCPGAGQLLQCTGTFCDPVPHHSRTQFGLWSVMAAPLLLSFDLSAMTSYQMATVSNPEVIAVNQDKAGYPGMRVGGGNLTDFSPPSVHAPSTWNVWARKLDDESHAVIFINTANATADVTCDSQCFAKMGYDCSQNNQMSFTIRDLWARQDLPNSMGCSYTAKQVQGDAGSVLLKVKQLSSKKL